VKHSCSESECSICSSECCADPSLIAVIPLAKKLKNCGVFGVASDEYLTYALDNRREWETRGKDIVSDMIKKVTCAAENIRELETPRKNTVNCLVEKVNNVLETLGDEIKK
jgi:hypothetical protein